MVYIYKLTLPVIILTLQPNKTITLSHSFISPFPLYLHLSSRVLLVDIKELWEMMSLKSHELIFTALSMLLEILLYFSKGFFLSDSF